MEKSPLKVPAERNIDRVCVYERERERDDVIQGHSLKNLIDLFRFLSFSYLLFRISLFDCVCEFQKTLAAT